MKFADTHTEAALGDSETMREARDWAKLAEDVSSMLEYIPTEHYVDDARGCVVGVIESSQYVRVYPALIALERECDQMAGLKLRLAGAHR